MSMLSYGIDQTMASPIGFSRTSFAWGRSLVVLALAVAVPSCASRATPPASLELAAADEEQEVGFLCPMHPDHTSEAPGRCPICNMTLVPGALYDMRDYELDVTSVPEQVKAGEKATLHFGVKHPGTGERITKFELPAMHLHFGRGEDELDQLRIGQPL